jgi:hypothetical protein
LSEKSLRIPARIYISTGDFAHSNYWHFPERNGSEEALYFSFYLSQEWFNWLCDEIRGRPDDLVGVRMHLMTWLSGIEGHIYCEVSFNPIRIEDNGQLPILDARFHVGQFQKEVETVPDEPLTASGKLEAALESLDPAVWLKRIFWTLIGIAAVLLFMR